MGMRANKRGVPIFIRSAKKYSESVFFHVKVENQKVVETKCKPLR